MHKDKEFTLARDVEAILIPSGAKTTIPQGTPGVITQALGGSYTVATYQGLARVSEKDADALGLEKTAASNGAEKSVASSNGDVDEKMVWDQLKQCFDPEIPVNIVDLGLVYDCQLTKRPEGGTKVNVKMTGWDRRLRMTRRAKSSRSTASTKPTSSLSGTRRGTRA